jgi:hypothetical protein
MWKIVCWMHFHFSQCRFYNIKIKNQRYVDQRKHIKIWKYLNQLSKFIKNYKTKFGNQNSLLKQRKNDMISKNKQKQIL